MIIIARNIYYVSVDVKPKFSSFKQLLINGNMYQEAL